MTKRELANELKRLEIRPTAYWLEGGDPDDRYVLARHTDGRWSTYFSERGHRWEEKFYPDEDAACQAFLTWVVEMTRES